jgi:hypothetical protein
MTNKAWGASYERGLELMAAGCPLDFPEALPGHPALQRKSFHARQLDGYVQSHVYAVGPLRTDYLIGLRLWTDNPSGTIITNWRFVAPWPNQVMCWDYEPLDVIPKNNRGPYMDLLDSPLMGVLNERRLLTRGYPIEGLLCGRSSQPIPDSFDRSVAALLELTDDRGSLVDVRLNLIVVEWPSTHSDSLQPRPRGLLN